MPNSGLPPAIMLLGTTSNAGKSLLAAGLCRIFARMGLKTAPFKAQNMSLNSYVTATGGEIGIAQALQAKACGLEPSELMNPVLLKPMGTSGSQIIVLGQPLATMSYQEYIHIKPQIWRQIEAAYTELACGKDVMVLEGAGSPAEINLQAHDVVNMCMCRHAGACGLLVADIDRGGAFAALAGTMLLLHPSDRKLVSAFILNKFRGDSSLLTPALQSISHRLRRPFAGIMPWLEKLILPDEDSVSIGELPHESFASPSADCLDVAILDLPAMSNIADWDPLKAEPHVHTRLVKNAIMLGKPHVIIIPGSRNVPKALEHLRQSGLDKAICGYAEQVRQTRKGQIIGICAGLQILGEMLVDNCGLEGQGRHACLGLIPLVTSLEQHKILRRQQATAAPEICGTATVCFGQEIHHGQCHGSARVVIATAAGKPLGWQAPDQPNIWGTWLHGIFDSNEFRHAWLDKVGKEWGLGVTGCGKYSLDAELDRLADTMKANLDIDMITSWLAL